MFLSQPDISAFIKYYSFPISLLSLSIVFGVMVARFHSSKQKAKSNSIIEANNAVNIFYKNHDEFHKYTERLLIPDGSVFSSIDSVECYRFLFKTSTAKKPMLVISDETIREVEKFYYLYYSSLIAYISSEKYKNRLVKAEYGEQHSFLDDHVYSIQSKFGFSIKGLFHLYYIKDFDQKFNTLHGAVIKLISFPGVDNFLEAQERLSIINSKFIQILDDSVCYQTEIKSLQTLQD
ncbi:hypothetical protein ACOBV9_11305 [Pseudoalteromonas espejiana]